MNTLFSFYLRKNGSKLQFFLLSIYVIIKKLKIIYKEKISVLKEKKKPYLWKVLIRQAKIIIEYKKSYLFWIFLLHMVCAGTLPIIAVIFPKLIIDSFDESMLDQIYLYTGVLVGASLILAILISTCKAIKQGQFVAIRLKEFERYNRKYLKIDYKYMEDSKFHDKSQTAMHTLSTNHIGFEGAYHTVFDILPLFFSVTLYLVIIGRFNIVLIIIALLGAIVSMIITSLTANYAYKKKDELARARRFVNYYYNTCYDFAYGKDIRIYEMTDKVIKNYQKKTISYLSVFRNIKNKEFVLALYELVMLLVQDGLAYYFVINAYYEDLITLGDLSMYLRAIIAL